jgi:hypothetical protein
VDRFSNGTIDVGEVQKFVQGCNDLLEVKLDRFNEKVRSKEASIMAAPEDPLAKFVLVIAYTGQQAPSPEVRRPLDDLLNALNDPTEMATLHIFGTD